MVSKSGQSSSFSSASGTEKSSDRILKVARTIADLEGCADVLTHHIMEPIAYCTLDCSNYLGNML